MTLAGSLKMARNKLAFHTGMLIVMEILQQVGFEKTHKTSLILLTEILFKYLHRIGTTISSLKSLEGTLGITERDLSTLLQLESLELDCMKPDKLIDYATAQIDLYAHLVAKIPTLSSEAHEISMLQLARLVPSKFQIYSAAACSRKKRELFEIPELEALEKSNQTSAATKGSTKKQMIDGMEKIIQLKDEEALIIKKLESISASVQSIRFDEVSIEKAPTIDIPSKSLWDPLYCIASPPLYKQILFNDARMNDHLHRFMSYDASPSLFDEFMTLSTKKVINFGGKSDEKEAPKIRLFIAK